MNIAVETWLESSPRHLSAHTEFRNLAELANGVGGLASQALIKEVELTPKPGLVDLRNTGSHRDMDVHTFYASARALSAWFPVFFLRGLRECHVPPVAFLSSLRADGLAAERDMFHATRGINTHKGSVFALGLLCAAAGRLAGQQAGRLLPVTRDDLCDEVARMCAHLVQTELCSDVEATTVGELLFQRHGMTGARGEAASGFATVREHGLPASEKALERGADEQTALLAALLALMANNADTNVVSRGGMTGLAFVQERARALIAAGGVEHPDFVASFIAFDDACIERNLSPGGSADLLAVTWFLARFDEFIGSSI